jgi:CheY-like chemotaxis protein
MHILVPRTALRCEMLLRERCAEPVTSSLRQARATKHSPKFQRFAPDLAITDLVMPEMDGIQTTMATRSLGAKTKILV